MRHRCVLVDYNVLQSTLSLIFFSIGYIYTYSTDFILPFLVLLYTVIIVNIL